MHTRRSIFREDRGAVAVTVAILLIVFLGLAALSVDMGYLYTVKRQLQSSADAAALAGVRELIEGADEAGVLVVAEEYAQLNEEIPADGLVMVNGAPLTEVGSDFVRVTVEKESPLFFGRMWAADPTIQATAEARVSYITGLSGLVPIGLPILRATSVKARLSGSPAAQVDLIDQGGGQWRGNLPVPAMPAGTSRMVHLDITNSQGYTETWENVSVVHAVDPAKPFQSVSAGPSVVVNRPNGTVDPSTVTMGVVATGETTLRFNGVTRQGSNSYSATFPSPATAAARDTFLVELFVGNKATGKADLSPAAIVNSVRSSHPLKGFTVSNRYFTPGVAGSATIDLGLHDYVFGDLYHMKIESNPEAGNFGALSFTTGGGSSTFGDHLRNGYDGIISIGDEVDTEPGGMNASHVKSAIDFRASGVSFDQWVAEGMPRSSPSLVYVPVVEKIAPITGRKPYIVVSFAAFYIEQADSNKAEVVGRFVEYVMPSVGHSPFPPGGMYIQTYSLVTPQTEMSP